MLVADFAGLPVGLYVPALGPITAIEQAQIAPIVETPAAAPSKRKELLKGLYAGFLVLDVPVLLADIVRQIEMAALDE